MTGEGLIEIPIARVLVVDDERTIRTLLELQLSSRALDVTVAASGEEALEKMRLERIGCALIDKNLPGIDGFEVMRRAAELQPFCRCIMITAYGTKEAAIDALQSGAIDFIEKPFADLDLVVEKVRNALKQEQLAVERDTLLQRLGAYDARLGATELLLDRLKADAEVGVKIREEIRRRLPSLLDEVQKLAAESDDQRLPRIAQLIADLLVMVDPPEA